MTDKSAPLLFRVDSNSEIGSGHFMRCAALADAWRDIGGTSRFVCKDINPQCQAIAKSQFLDVYQSEHEIGSLDDAEFLVQMAKQWNCNEIIADGYRFNADFRRALRNKKISVVAIDDGDAIPDETDLVINQNAHAEHIDANGGEIDLLGLKYCLIGKRFLPWLQWTRTVSEKPRKFLVCFGGGNHLDWIAKTVSAITSSIPTCEIVVVGATQSQLAQHIDSVSDGHTLTCFEHTSNIDRLMSDADIAIGASGSMTWERAFMQLPSISIALAKNQEPLGQAINELGIGVHLGCAQEVDQQQLADAIVELTNNFERRCELALKGRETIDGYGCDRVVQVISRQPVRLRRANESDKEILFEWVNEPKVREMSFTREPVKWDEHCRWFAKRVSNDNCFLFIAHDNDDVPVGQIRFELDFDMADVSISLSAKYRGRGLSRAILKQGLARAKVLRKLKRINAYIQPGNKPSIQLFRGAGFVPMPATAINGYPALHYVYDIEPEKNAETSGE